MSDLGIDYSAWRFWFDVFQLAGTVALGVYVWFSNRHRVTKKSLDDHESRLTCLESDMKHLPDQDKFDALMEKIALFNGELKEMKGSLKGINRAVDLMNQHLLNRSEK